VEERAACWRRGENTARPRTCCQSIATDRHPRQIDSLEGRQQYLSRLSALPPSPSTSAPSPPAKSSCSAVEAVVVASRALKSL
jgi:hypothetical protein